MHLIPLDQDKEPTCGRGFLDEANYEQNTQKVIPGEMYGVLQGDRTVSSSSTGIVTVASASLNSRKKC